MMESEEDDEIFLRALELAEQQHATRRAVGPDLAAAPIACPQNQIERKYFFIPVRVRSGSLSLIM